VLRSSVGPSRAVVAEFLDYLRAHYDAPSAAAGD
jgi:hypothetical protein